MKKRNDNVLGLRFSTVLRPWLFPLLIAGLYLLAGMFFPEKIERALHLSGAMLRQLIVPVCLALLVMVLFNRFLSQAKVVQYLGGSSGLKGIILSSIAGIVSMGPVYAWYPLLQTMKGKGASVFHLVNFMGNRSIKPFLLPILIGYWGWRFSVLFVLLSFVGALITAFIVSMLCPESSK